MRNGRIIEGTHDVCQRVHVAQMPEVSAFFQCFLADGTHVDVFDRGMRKFFWLIDRRQAIETIVGDFGDAYVGLAWIGVSMIRKISLGEDSKKRGFADLRQSNDARFHAVGSSRLILATGVSSKLPYLQNCWPKRAFGSKIA